MRTSETPLCYLATYGTVLAIPIGEPPRDWTPIYLDTVRDLMRERDEARAEVERLRALGEEMAAGIEALCADPGRERWELICDPLDAWRAAGGEP
jgi:hypothetical protein